MRVGQLEAFGDLKDKFSPGIAGGVAITTYFPPPYPDSGAGCTLGVNVKLTYTDTAWDALTAAHCTATIGGGPDPTLMAQPGNWPSYSAGDRMAHEVADPYWQSCPQGVGKQYCRYADVAAFQYDRTRVADSGYVDVTVKLDSMTTKWISKDSTSRRVTGYWSDQPWEGVDLEHVGVTTGWHSGTVEESCLNTPVVVYGYSTDHEWLCQTKVDGIANHGDSGGPVFSAGPGRNILFAGLLSEGDTASNYYYMSSYANICLDFNACPVVTWF